MMNIEQLAETINNLNKRVTLLENSKTKAQTGLDMNPQAIWTPKHIAKYTGLSYGYIRNHLINSADFPKYIQRNTGTTRQRKLYLAGEIIEYFNQHNKN